MEREKMPGVATQPNLIPLEAYRPWQCLYFLPELQGQSSLRPTLLQLLGLFEPIFPQVEINAICASATGVHPC
jgi:hypothetical protein